MRKNEKGSSLIFAVVVIMVIAITIAAALAISFSYYNRSIAANTERQAYLTAKSVLTNIVDNIDAENKDYLNLIPDGTKSSSKTLEVKDFPSDLGKIDNANLSVSQRTEGDVVKEVLTISVTATYADKTQIINADFKRTKGKSAWNFEKYYEGNAENKVNQNNAYGQQLYDYATDMFLLKNKYSNWKDYLIYDDISKKTLSEFYKNCVAYNKVNFDNVYFNDNVIRQLIWYGYYKGEFNKFDNSLVNPNISDKSKKFLKENQSLYILIKYPHSSNTPSIIFAHPTNTGDISNWNFNTYLFYLPIENAWYYVYNGYKVQSFDDKDPIKTLEKWNNFVNEVLHDNTKAEKIT